MVICSVSSIIKLLRSKQEVLNLMVTYIDLLTLSNAHLLQCLDDREKGVKPVLFEEWFNRYGKTMLATKQHPSTEDSSAMSKVEIPTPSRCCECPLERLCKCPVLPPNENRVTKSIRYTGRLDNCPLKSTC